MNGMRRTALTLHGLAANDREWMLSRLPASHRAELDALLQELRTLGIPADAAVREDALKPLPLPETQPAPPATPEQRLAAASPLALLDLLQAESPAVIALLIQAADWPWREQYLRMLPPAMSTRLETVMLRTQEVTQALRAALIEATVMALEQADPPVTGSVRRWGRRLKAALARRGPVRPQEQPA